MSLLYFKNIHISGANAMSSPYTIGFPAITSWLGFMHSLEKKLHADGYNNIFFNSIGIVSHSFKLHVYNANDTESSIIITRNPLNPDGSSASFIPQARCDLDVSLLIDFSLTNVIDDVKKTIEKINKLIYTMKISGGDIIKFESINIENIIYTHNVETDSKNIMLKIIKSLNPGYVLIERRDLLINTMNKDNCDALDALLSFLTIEHRQELSDNKTSWIKSKKEDGWLIPIPIGYQRISQLGKAENQRDSSVEHCFAESVLTLGEFKMIHHFHNFENLLWEYDSSLESIENGLYLCKQVKVNY